MDCIQEEEKEEQEVEESYIISDTEQGLLIKRTHWISTDIDENVVVALGEFLELMDGNEPVHIHIMSSGGGVAAALAIVDMITTFPSDVYTYAHGIVASAALFIFACGDNRKVFPHTRFAWHLGTLTVMPSETLELCDFYIDEGKHRLEIAHEIFNNMCKMPKNVQDKAKHTGIFFGADDALRWKIADNIIKSKR